MIELPIETAVHMHARCICSSFYRIYALLCLLHLPFICTLLTMYARAQLHANEGHAAEITACAFKDDGSQFVTGGADRLVKVGCMPFSVYNLHCMEQYIFLQCAVAHRKHTQYFLFVQCICCVINYSALENVMPN